MTDIIKGPGAYVMRNGGKAEIIAMNGREPWACVGYDHLEDKSSKLPAWNRPSAWRRDGFVYADKNPSHYDIVGPWREKASGTVERWVTKLHLTACDDVTEKMARHQRRGD